MNTIDPSQQDLLKARLLQRRQALKGELWTHLHQGEMGDMAVSNHGAEGSDHAVADLQADIDLKTMSNELVELDAIEAALRQLADGSYGVCTSCGETIAIERLTAQPTATRCLPCQQQLEHRAPGPHHASM